jgi:hypothetical protein
MPDDMRQETSGDGNTVGVMTGAASETSPGATTVWLTYGQLAASRGISVRSAQRLAQRHRWPRRPGNDGTARIGVPAGAEKPTERSQGDDRGGDEGDGGGVVATLKEAFATALAAKDGEIAAVRGELSTVRGMFDGFRLERDRALADLQVAQTAQGEAEANAAELRQAEEERKARGRWARLRAAWRGE